MAQHGLTIAEYIKSIEESPAEGDEAVPVVVRQDVGMYMSAALPNQKQIAQLVPLCEYIEERRRARTNISRKESVEARASGAKLLG